MPELPEVETTVRSLRQPLIGRTIIGVRNSWPGHIATPSLSELEGRISGQEVQAIERRGKYLVFTLSAGETLIIHLKMSGHLSVVSAQDPMPKHVHTVFPLSDGRELRFRDQRKFGRVYLVKDVGEVLGRLGPEPLASSFTVEALQGQLRGRKRALKPLLLDQSFIAGIGNIYANEALYYARLSPSRPANSLSTVEVKALHRGIQKALRLGLEHGGASIDQYQKPNGSKGNMQNALTVHGREGLPCNRCGNFVQRSRLGGRSTYFCPQCQL